MLLQMNKTRLLAILFTFLGLLQNPAVCSAPEEPTFKPGFNFYKPADDIEIGKQSVPQIEKEVPLLRDSAIENYVSKLGHSLVEYAPGFKEYPWTFKVVNSQDINAFALPGGFIYVNRGVLETAVNEGQLAGVVAHEIGHVVMRHGTHQASQARLGQGALGALGAIFGGGGAGGQIAQVGAGFLTTSILLKNSRGAESQSDEIGTYMLYEAGYDPHSMAEFFDILGKKYPQQTAQFFSDHPNPDNRVKRVNKYIAELGPSKQRRNDTPEFQSARKRSLGLPAPAKAQPAVQPGAQPAPATTVGTPARPSSRQQVYNGNGWSMQHPENWQVQDGDTSTTLAPAGGIFRSDDGQWAQAYGASVFRLKAAAGRSLENTTENLIRSWQQANPAMRVLQQKNGKVSGRAALSTTLENDSPLAGQKETIVMVAVDDPKGALAVLFIVPKSEYKTYQSTFSAMLKSLKLN